MMQGNYTEAIQAYDEAIGLDPRNAAACYNKGYVLEALGRTAEAKEAYIKAQELGSAGMKAG
jgi:Flp pilus assembly protein TadD